MLLFPGVVLPMTIVPAVFDRAAQEAVRASPRSGLCCRSDPDIEQPAPEHFLRVGILAEILPTSFENTHYSLCRGLHVPCSGIPPRFSISRCAASRIGLSEVLTPESLGPDRLLKDLSREVIHLLADTCRLNPGSHRYSGFAVGAGPDFFLRIID